jgi:Cu/Ag efflux pump CusA
MQFAASATTCARVAVASTRAVAMADMPECEGHMAAQPYALCKAHCEQGTQTVNSTPAFERAITNLSHKLIEEFIVVALVCALFLWHLRSALVAIIALPLGVLTAFLVMRYQGINANIMSMGGIAIAIGAMVDAAVVMIENAHRRLEAWQRAHPGPAGPVGAEGRRAAAAHEPLDQDRARSRARLRQGRAGRDRHRPAPLEMFETTIQLKDRSQWRAGLTPEKLVEELDRAVQVPGLSNLWVPPIRNRIDMLATGIKSPIGVKVTGGDLAAIDRVALRIEQVAKSVPGVASALAERLAGGAMSTCRSIGWRPRATA